MNTEQQNPKLIFRLSDGTSCVERLDRPMLTIGRSGEFDIVIPDPSLSNPHARVEYEEGRDRWTVHDLGSTNGISDGQQKALKVALSDGARFFVGDVVVEVNMGSAPAAPDPSSCGAKTPAEPDSNIDISRKLRTLRRRQTFSNLRSTLLLLAILGTLGYAAGYLARYLQG